MFIKKALKPFYRVSPPLIKRTVINSYQFIYSSLTGAINIQNIKFDKNSSTVCILGNGPSLTQDKKVIKELIDTHDFICVNNFCDDEMYRKIKPKLYVFLDGYFFSSNAHSDWVIRREKTFKTINNKTTWKMKIVVPLNADTSILKQHINNSNVEIIKVNTLNLYASQYNKSTRMLFDCGFFGPPKINVLIYGIYLAILAKYKTIKVFGADLSFHNDVEVDQTTNDLFIRFRHFNEKDSIELLKKNPSKIHKFRMSELLELSTNTFKAHEILYQYALDKGIKITNNSSFSLIDAYPRNIE